MNVREINNFSKIFCLVTAITLAATVSLSPAYSQQIITDGNTQTALNIAGNKTTVSTNSIVNGNAFNSFKKFNVNAGNTVDVIVPGSVAHLINLVHNEKSLIDGKLNFLRNGKIDGNVFFVNPHGVTVGAQGMINVQSLTVVTPTQAFMNSFFTSKGNPDSGALNDLVNGKMAVNSKAEFVNEGKINAGHKFNVISGIASNYGFIDSNADFDYSNMNDIINLNSLAKGVNMVDQDGEISIVATGDVTVMGDVLANQKLDYNLNFQSKEGNVNVFANMVGRVKAQADKGDVTIAQFYKDLNLYKVKAKNNVNIFGIESIVDARNTEDANVIGKNVNMYSLLGSIGNGMDDLNIQTDAAAGGKLYAYANDGEINITQNKGDLAVKEVFSRHNVQIRADGSILDGNVVDITNVWGDNVTLISENGNIGSLTDDLDIETNYGSGPMYGVLRAFASKGSIYIEDHGGILNVEEVFAGGDVEITAFDTIRGTAYGPTNITGNNIKLTSTIGAINSSGGALTIEANHPGSGGSATNPGTLTAIANNNIYIQQIAGDLYVKSIKTKEDVYLYSDGSILNGSMTSWPNIDAEDIDLTSYNGGIGTAVKPFIIQSNHTAYGGALTAKAVGDIFIFGYGDLYLNTVKTDGNISLNASGLYSNSPGDINVSGADIDLTSSGSIGTKSTPLKLSSTTGVFNTCSNDTNILKYVPIQLPDFTNPFTPPGTQNLNDIKVIKP